MTIYVTQPYTNNRRRFTKPKPVLTAYQSHNPRMLQHLVSNNPTAIYFSDDPDEDFGPFEPEASDLRVLLANRLLIHSNAIDAFREERYNAFRPDDYLRIARGVETSLAVMEEIERIWEALYGEKPTTHDMLKWS